MVMTSAMTAARAALTSHPHLNSTELSDILGGDVTANHLARMRRRHNVLALRFVRLGYLYPAFQFDVSAGRVHPSVMATNRRLCGTVPPEEALLWWFTPDQDGHCPYLRLTADAATTDAQREVQT
jgi:hypothetical protein